MQCRKIFLLFLWIPLAIYAEELEEEIDSTDVLLEENDSLEDCVSEGPKISINPEIPESKRDTVEYLLHPLFWSLYVKDWVKHNRSIYKTLTYDGVIAGERPFIQNRQGCSILSNVNTYTKGTLVREGILQISDDKNLGNTQGCIQLFGGTLQTTKNLLSLRAMELRGDASIQVDKDTTFTHKGSIRGSGMLHKKGKGELFLQGNNSFTGSIMVSEGILHVQDIDSLGRVEQLILDGGILQNTKDICNTSRVDLRRTSDFRPENNVIYLQEGEIFGLGGLVKKGRGYLGLRVQNTYLGDTYIEEGVLGIQADNNLGSEKARLICRGGILQIAKNTEMYRSNLLEGYAGFFVNNDAHFLHKGKISGKGSLYKLGQGILCLDNENVYTGGTYLEKGDLQVSQEDNLGDILACLFLRGGRLQIQKSFLSNRCIRVENPSEIHTMEDVHFNHRGSLLVQELLMKKGVGTLSLWGTNTWEHSLHVLEGMVIGDAQTIPTDICNHATVVFHQEKEPGRYAHQASGCGDWIKKGFKELEITGDQSPATGNLFIQEDTLRLNGKFGGNVFVEKDAIFFGNAEIGKNFVNQGSVCPGNSIGQIDILGDYIQDPAGLLHIDITPDGQTDLVNVTGLASLDGTLVVDPVSGIYPAHSTFVFLQASNVVGTFPNIQKTLPLNFQILYTPTTAYIYFPYTQIILPIPTSQLNGNARVMAEYLFCSKTPTAGTDLYYVWNNLMHLSPQDYIYALNALTPAPFGAFPLTNLETATWVAHTCIEETEQYYWCHPCNRMRASNCTEKKGSLWLAPLGQWYKQNKVQQQTGFWADSYGVLFGGNYCIDYTYNCLAAVGYLHTFTSWEENHGYANTDSLYACASLGLVRPLFYTVLLGMGAFHFYDADRRIEYPGMARTAHSHHTGYNFFARWDTGVRLMFSQGSRTSVSLIPEVRLGYLQTYEGDYREHGADSVNLYIEDTTFGFFRPHVLCKFMYEYMWNRQCVSLSTHLGWVAIVPTASGKYTARFFRGGVCMPDFTISTTDIMTNQLSAGAEVTFNNADWGLIGAEYEIFVLDKSVVNSAKIKINWFF